AATRRQLERGQRVTELMKQKQYSPLSVAEMALSLFAVNNGYLDDVPVNKVVPFETGLPPYPGPSHRALLDRTNARGDYYDEIDAELKKAVEGFKSTGAY